MNELNVAIEYYAEINNSLNMKQTQNQSKSRIHPSKRNNCVKQQPYGNFKGAF